MIGSQNNCAGGSRLVRIMLNPNSHLYNSCRNHTPISAMQICSVNLNENNAVFAFWIDREVPVLRGRTATSLEVQKQCFDADQKRRLKLDQCTSETFYFARERVLYAHCSALVLITCQTKCCKCRQGDEMTFQDSRFTQSLWNPGSKTFASFISSSLVSFLHSLTLAASAQACPGDKLAALYLVSWESSFLKGTPFCL